FGEAARVCAGGPFDQPFGLCADAPAAIGSNERAAPPGRGSLRGTGEGYLMSWTPSALLPVPAPTPGPTVPVERMSVNLPTRHCVAPLPVSHSALLLPLMYAPYRPPQATSAGW